MIRRQVSYQWRLRETMATAGIFTATELVPLLAERGITLSASQVHRLVSGTPERVSLQTLAALCDILDVTPAQLIATRAENVAPRRAAATSSDVPIDVKWRRQDPLGRCGGCSRPRGRCSALGF